jgi:uncharacterized repeat protein (TIGR03803 family)
LGLSGRAVRFCNLLTYLLGLTYVGTCYAQTFTLLKTFEGPDGSQSAAGLVVDGSTLYGTTRQGGTFRKGTVFRINTDGTEFRVLRHLAGAPDDAGFPSVELILSGGVLYGTSSGGGASDAGTIYRLNKDGTHFLVIKNFSNLAGNYPYTNYDGAVPAGLTASGSKLYGVTERGGVFGNGVIFSLNTLCIGSPTNSDVCFTVLRSFSRGAYNPTSYFTNADGSLPFGRPVLSGNVLYGTTREGGELSYGTVFKMNVDGTGFRVLKTFEGTDGAWAMGALALDGNVLYGTAAFGGLGFGTVFKINTDGSAFTVLTNIPFAYLAGGYYPYAGLTRSGNLLFGTTYAGGCRCPTNSDSGMIFRMSTNGTGYTALKIFTSLDSDTNSDGAHLFGLALAGGTLYGTTYVGGASSNGTIFKLDLVPPVAIQRAGPRIVVQWTNGWSNNILQYPVLQVAPAVDGEYSNVPSATSPYTNPVSGPQKFFRLIGQ